MTRGQWHIVKKFMRLVMELLYKIAVKTIPVTADGLHYEIREFIEDIRK